MFQETIVLSVKEWVGLIRDVIEIIGLPAIAVYALKLHSLQTAALKAENSLLKLTQYDQAEKILKGQKDVFERERGILETTIRQLQSSRQENESEILELNARVKQINQQLDSLNKSRLDLGGADFQDSLFSESLNFRSSRFCEKVDFSCSSFAKSTDFGYVLFSEAVSFAHAVFRDVVSLDRANLRRASFNGTDLRGADLSNAIVDSKTKFPAEATRLFETPRI